MSYVFVAARGTKVDGESIRDLNFFENILTAQAQVHTTHAVELPRAGRVGPGVVNGGLELGEVLAAAPAPGVGDVLDEAEPGALDVAGAGGQGPDANLVGLAGDGVDEEAAPGVGVADVLDGQVEGVRVVGGHVDGAGDAVAAALGAAEPRAGLARRVAGGRAGLVRGEVGAEHGLALAVVGARLDGDVALAPDAVEAELLREVVALLAGSLGHVDGERDVFEARLRAVDEFPPEAKADIVQSRAQQVDSIGQSRDADADEDSVWCIETMESAWFVQRVQRYGLLFKKTEWCGVLKRMERHMMNSFSTDSRLSIAAFYKSIREHQWSIATPCLASR
ncbi:hypothetical protein E5D57_008471 [Metarhizium anisopliae]|nr:hypothetical protein E5D57_008471 [Metarhizium anisopliae]